MSLSTRISTARKKAFTAAEVTGAIANETGVKEKIKNKLGGK